MESQQAHANEAPQHTSRKSAGALSRREVFAGGLAAASAVVGAPMLRCWSEETPRTDRSAAAPSSPVAIQRCDSYDPKPLREAMAKSLDLIDGVNSLVSGKTVTIKLNLTGMSWKPAFGLPAQETYQTQPDTVAVLCALFAEAGARRIVLVENTYWERPIEETLLRSGWDVKAIQSAGEHRVYFEDTRNRGAFKGYSRFEVPWGGFVYPAFDLNERFEKTDVLVSLAKLKQHACAGVTGAVKNFFGNTPSSLYGDRAPDERGAIHRVAMFHSARKRVPDGVPAELTPGTPSDARVRVPRITADIFGARPADLNLVDGVRSISGGEGHWNRGIGLVEPKVLLAGRNGVCTDALATAVMGFDPQAEHGQFPFQGDNHLRLLASVGVGTNDPKRIEVRGVPVAEALHPYTNRDA